MHGAKVAIVENKVIGGTCVNVGCIPKKLYVYAANYKDAFKDSEGEHIHQWIFEYYMSGCINEILNDI